MDAAKILDPAVSAMLREDLPKQLQQIESSLHSNELGNARDLVHSVHGSAAFCKLNELRDTAARLENALLNNNKNDQLVHAFMLEAKKIIAALHGNDN